MEPTIINEPSLEEVGAIANKCNSFYQDLLKNTEEKKSSALEISFSKDTPLTIIKNTDHQRILDGFSYKDNTSYIIPEDQVAFKEIYTLYRIVFFYNCMNIDLEELGARLLQKNKSLFGEDVSRRYSLFPDYKTNSPTGEEKESAKVLFQIGVFQKRYPLFYIDIHYEGKLIIIASPEKNLSEQDNSILQLLCDYLAPLYV